MAGETLILGGTGNFGARIARALAGGGFPVIVAGRNRAKAEAFAASLPGARADGFEAEHGLAARLEALRPALVINASGPFQGSSYGIARQCIAARVAYVDLADGRDFVAGIGALDAEAKAAGIAVISGASTVPGLSSAVLEHFRGEFSVIDQLVYGISPGQKAARGKATTAGVLSYVGKPLRPFAGAKRPVYGWQDLYRQDYPVLGKRWMANCEIPDLDLLPARYGIGAIRFSAGLELSLLHLGLWCLSWAIRLGLPLDLKRHAGLMLRASNLLNAFGSPDGGMHMILSGRDRKDRPHARRWFLVARDGDGPQIPCVASIVLAKRVLRGEAFAPGAYACLGLVTLEECLEELRGFAVRQYIFPETAT